MIDLIELKLKLQKKWYKYYLPCGLHDEKSTFPLIVSLKPPTNKQILNDWQAVKSWVNDLTKKEQNTFKIIQKEQKTPLGKQNLPREVVFLTLNDLALFLKQTKQLANYQNTCQQILSKYPTLEPWCLKFTEKVISHQQDWQNLLKIIAWFINNPQSGQYLREISIQNIDTKFIEKHKPILNELLSILLPEFAEDKNYAANFEQKFGLKKELVSLRIRFLGEQSLLGLQDIQAPLCELQTVNLQALGIQKVFVTENKINFLAFPEVKNSLIIFGKGYGFKDWKNWQSLKELPLFYWGDLDVDGFTILNQFKKEFPQTQSILMDEKTLLQHQQFWIEDKPKPHKNLNYLNQEQQQLYQKIINNNWQKNIRLEQERVQFECLIKVLSSTQ